MGKQLYKLVLALCIFSGTPAMGKSISAEQALEYSLAELTSLIHTNVDPAQMKLVGHREYNGAVRLYIYSSPSMYVIASVDDNIPGLLAYSLDGGFSANVPPSMEWWLEQYSQNIGMTENSVIQFSHENRSPIPPMISSEWNQCAPYNNLLPEHNGSIPYTGCVATAMAQIMRYYEWPMKGRGAIQWTCNRDYTSHDHVFNFEDAVFDWENMVDKYDETATPQEEVAVARLMYACGAAAEMQYGYSASGSYLYLAASGLQEYLQYNRGMEYLECKWFESLDQWDYICYTELSEGRPILYGGENDERHTRHAFVLDGYSEEGMYHINWGFGGENNGYFKLTDFSYPGGSYRLNHSMVRGIKPMNEASVFIPAISLEGQFRTEETQYARSADVNIWFMEDFRNVSITDFWYLHGVKCVPIDGSAEFYVNCEDKLWYRPRGVRRFYTISADKFPVGVYDVYPVFKTDTTDWMPCYQDRSKKDKSIRFIVTETTIDSTPTSSIEDVRVEEMGNPTYYDLYGNKVYNPKNGIFIRVINGKVTKIKI